MAGGQHGILVHPLSRSRRGRRQDRHFYQQIYFHRLGEDPAKDAYVAGKDFPKVAEIQLDNRFDPDRWSFRSRTATAANSRTI